jgi:hypothetical protein
MLGKNPGFVHAGLTSAFVLLSKRFQTLNSRQHSTTVPDSRKANEVILKIISVTAWRYSLVWPQERNLNRF